MAKKKSNIGSYLAWIIPSIIGLAILIVLILFLTGVFKFPSQSITPTFGNLDIITLFGQAPSGDCTFSVDDNEVCVFDNVTGTIRANSPTCYIGFNYNNEGWKFAGIINEISTKFYKESRQATVIGNYIFASICGTPSNFCRTNDVEVDVITCDDDGEDEGCDYTCGWVGEQCGGTCPADYPLCVDMWYENIIHPDYIFCACINPDTEEIHPDWKPGEDCHDDSGFPDGDGEDFFEDIEDYTCGQGSDAQCGGTCPSDYQYCVKDWEDLYLYNCVCENLIGDIHPEWESDGSMFNEQGEYPPEESNCIDSDGVDVFTVGTTTYLGVSHPDVCHAGQYYAVDEYVCIDDVAVKKEIQCPYGPVGGCADGRCVEGTTTVYNACLDIGYANGGGCYSGDNPVAHPEFDLLCGDFYPLNHAICFS